MAENLLNGKAVNGNVEFKQFQLNNGLQVILSKDASIPTAAINLCYHVGSKDEERNKRGFAHLFEHLMFEGSKNLPPGAYDKMCVTAGGENNAYTTEDKTNYFIVIPAHELERGLWLESDRMLGFSVTEESFNTQKSVVKEEKNQVFDNRPYGTLSMELMPRLFKRSSYGWDTIGDMGDLEAATLADAKEFYEKFYVPNNAVLTIVGDIDFDKTHELIEKYFGDIAKGNDIKRSSFSEDDITSEIKDTIFDNVQFPGIFIGYRIPAENEGKFFSLDVLTDILSAGDSSRFHQRLVYDKQICSEVGCYIDPKEFASIFYIYAILMPGVTVGKVEKEIDIIIEEIKNGSATDHEIQKVKNRIETRYTYRKQTILSKADQLSHYKMFFNDPGLINTNANNYDSINARDITEAAIEYLNKNNRVVLNYLPSGTNGHEED
jgi:zinc protease